MSAPGASAPGRLSACTTGDNDASYRTALKGASLAFQRTGSRQQQHTPAQGLGAHEALVAATSSTSQHPASRAGSPTHPPSGNVSRNLTGASARARSSSIVGAGANVSQDHNQHEYNSHGPVTPHRQQSHITQALTPSHGASLLVPLGKSPAGDVKSPSLIAATLAASRSNSPSPRQSHIHTPAAQSQQQAPRRRGRMDSVGGQSASAASSSLSLVSGPDESSLPPTNALISMFEKKDDYKDPVKRPAQHSRHDSLQTMPLAGKTAPMVLRPHTPSSSSRATSPVLKDSVSPSRQASAVAWHASSPSPQTITAPRSPTLKSPKVLPPGRKKPPTPPPVRSRTFLPGLEKELDANQAKAETRPAKPPTPPPARSQTFLPSQEKSTTADTAKAEVRPLKPRPLTPPPPRTISRSQTVIVSPQPVRVASGSFLATEQASNAPIMKSAPAPVPQKPKKVQSSQPSPGRQRVPLTTRPNTNTVQTKTRLVRKMSMTSTSSHDTFVSASSAPSPGPEYPRRRTRSPSPSLLRAIRPLSAAGGQTQSQWNKPHAGPRHRASDAALDSLTSAIVAGSLASARATPTVKTPPTPPPRKRTPGLKKTLRQPPSKSDDETNEQKYKKHRIRSNKKHSHHEGSRKRWRDEITARERKRYEGVWASNRGYLVPQSNAKAGQDADTIVNIVARDIWSRSRLPFDELAEVWDLVDRDGRGVLNKSEFVVGMWLIDQRLRGRKIPQKVSDSVWGSAKGFEVVVGQLSKSSKHRR